MHDKALYTIADYLDNPFRYSLNTVKDKVNKYLGKLILRMYSNDNCKWCFFFLIVTSAFKLFSN